MAIQFPISTKLEVVKLIRLVQKRYIIPFNKKNIDYYKQSNAKKLFQEQGDSKLMLSMDNLRTYLVWKQIKSKASLDATPSTSIVETFFLVRVGLCSFHSYTERRCWQLHARRFLLIRTLLWVSFLFSHLQTRVVDISNSLLK